MLCGRQDEGLKMQDSETGSNLGRSFIAGKTFKNNKRYKNKNLKCRTRN